MDVWKRSTWTTTAMTAAKRTADPYRGVAVHWPGLSGKLGLKSHEDCERLMRTLEKNAMTGPEKYGAIPYQALACAHGLTEGRTVLRVNGANGSGQANVDYGSVCVLIGTEDTLLAAHKEAVRRALPYLNGARLYTHNDVRPSPTACPGPDLTKWIDAGAPAPKPPAPPKDDDAMRYVSLEIGKPLSCPSGKWTRVAFDVEWADDLNGHTEDGTGITLPAKSIATCGVYVEASAAVRARIVRGPQGGPYNVLAAGQSPGAGPLTVGGPPALSKDRVHVEIQPVGSGAASVTLCAFRVGVQARA